MTSSAHFRHIVRPCLWTAAVVVMASGCATVETTAVSSKGLHEDASAALKSGGVLYWLPKRTIKVTVTIAKQQADKVEASPGAAYPDFSRAFLLKQGANLLAEQKLKVVVNERGLLQSAAASSQPKIQEALQGLAGALAARQAAKGADARAVPACPDGEYAIQIQPETPLLNAGSSEITVEPSLCGYAIRLKRLFPADLAAPADGLSKLSLEGGNGFYARQELPYLVTAENKDKDGAKREFIVFSPSEAPVVFVPLATALFASTTTSFVLNDGSIKEFDQTKPGEAVALLTLPAQVIGAYFDAIGNLFTKRRTAASNEAEFLKAKADLSTVQLQSDLCAEAVRQAKSLDEVKSVCLAGK